MSDLPSQPIRFAELPNRKRSHFKITPTAPERAAIAQTLGILLVRKLRFEGEMTPVGKHDWRLTAQLGVTVQQTCVITLEPITTRIDDEITRSYLSDLPTLNDLEVEMTEDDSTESLPDTLDLVEVMMEAMVLAVPAYPRAKGAEQSEAVFADIGVAPMRDEDARPFAGLSALRDTLKNNDETDK